MKIYTESENLEMKPTSSIGISGSPDEIRAIAQFLIHAANEMEELKDDFGHLHLMDEWGDWNETHPDIQVFKSEI